MPNLLMILHRGLGPTIYRLPDGEIIWPGVIFNPKTGKPEGHDAFTLQALAAVHGAKYNLTENVRPAAKNFIEAALQQLGNEHGDEVAIFIPNAPKSGRDDNPAGK